MNEAIVCIREWIDQETPADTLYSILFTWISAINHEMESGNEEGAAAIIRKHGTKLEPTLTVELAKY